MNETTFQAKLYLQSLLSSIEARGIEQGTLEVTGYAGTKQHKQSNGPALYEPTREQTILIHFRYEESND